MDAREGRRDEHEVALCNSVRPRRFGYQLRCLEPDRHPGDHRWTPELVAEPLSASGRDFAVPS